MRAKKLEHIRFDDNNIGPHGCLALTKANWPRISTIDLRNNIITKKIIKLGTKDAIIWRRRTGI